MRRLIMAGIVVFLAAPGCWRGREEPRGPFEPRMAEGGGEFDTRDGAVDEEVSPARALWPVRQEARPRPSAPKGTLTRPDRDADYRARLDEVPIPVPSDRTPLVGVGEGLLVNALLAEVNGEVITREDVLGPLRPQIEGWRRELSPQEFEDQCWYVMSLRLREAISRRLVVQEAKRNLSEAEKQEIEATLGQIVKDLTAQAGSTLLLEEKLRVRHSSVQQEVEKSRERMLVQRFLREKIAPTIHVIHSELLQRYREVRDERYVTPTRVRLRLVAIHKDQFPDAEQAEALARAVHKRAKAGEDLARLARRYSHGVRAEQGGDWGYVTKGSFRIAAAEEVLFSLRSGQVGPLVVTDDAFYIVKAEERREGRTVPFVEVQDELERELRDQKYNRTVAKYIQELYERAYVRIFMENF